MATLAICQIITKKQHHQIKTFASGIRGSTSMPRERFALIGFQASPILRERQPHHTQLCIATRWQKEGNKWRPVHKASRRRDRGYELRDSPEAKHLLTALLRRGERRCGGESGVSCL